MNNQLNQVEGSKEKEPVYTAAEVKAFQEFVKAVTDLEKEADPNSKMFSVLGMVDTIIEDENINKLDSVLRENFNEYYLDTPAA